MKRGQSILDTSQNVVFNSPETSAHCRSRPDKHTRVISASRAIRIPSAPSAPYLNVLIDAFLLQIFNFVVHLLCDESELRGAKLTHDQDLPEVYFGGDSMSIGPLSAEKLIAKVLNRISFFSRVGAIRAYALMLSGAGVALNRQSQSQRSLHFGML